MKRTKGFSVIGIMALALAVISAGPASAAPIPFSVTATVGSDSITVFDNGTGDADSSLGWIQINTVLDGWYINEYVRSVAGGGDPDYLKLTSVNTGPANGKLKITVTDDFSNVNNWLEGYIYASSTYESGGTMLFKTSVTGDSPVSLGPYSGSFESFGSLPVFQNGGSYNVALEYTRTNPGGGELESRVDEYSVSVGVPTPEPATLLLLGSSLAGLAGLGALRRR
jgi:hypothetical protein